ncbi:hypothetical protein [Reinekea sp.]|jgi:hypothetical protein|uniref:hypothetical protein n=1 Tax=Reinekea sp. TaxID=1970455 RepID=UPI00398993DD
MTINATAISQAIKAQLETIPGLTVITGKSVDWINNPVYPVLVMEPKFERIEGISVPKIKYQRVWAVEIFVEQEDAESALTSLLREVFEALGLAQQQPTLASARISASDISFTLFIEQQPQSSADFQLTAHFVE